MSVGLIARDTGPILHLHEASGLELLSLMGSVHIPPGVERELNCLIHDWSTARPVWMRVLELEGDFSDQATFWTESGLLHKGESEALALALQLKVPWFLTDETSARVLAKSFHLQAHGSLGIVLWAAAHGHLDRQESLIRLEALFESSLWVSPAIRAEAREAWNRIYSSS
jgi:predicted nucleic acid-binding protein